MSTPSHAIAKAVAATAAVTLFLAGIFFYLFHKLAISRYRQRHKVAASFLREKGVNHADIKKVSGNVKGLVVEENGVDVLYMMDSDSRPLKTRFSKSWLNPSFEDTEGKKLDVKIPRLCEDAVKPVSQVPTLLPSVSASSPPTQEVSQLRQPKVLEQKTAPLPPSPPPPPPPPPSPFPPRKEVPKVPLEHSSLPPPPPKVSSFTSSIRPSPAPKGKSDMSSRDKGGDAKRLKPLHWDKVVANVDHSTVWDQINDGSFRFDDQLIETLFGYSTNNKTTERKKGLSAHSNSNPQPQIFILEPRKSQNTAIVLKSLAISRNGILEALLDGQGLSADTLERLTKIAPTQEEAAKIMHFNENPDRLADAESFLYFILKAVPTAFTRLKAMLFRSSYDSEVMQHKEHLQTLEMGCKELRTSGLFIKLLEAILKAGNRMNAGTSRGNAQGFNLSSLRKLPDVKSTDGKTSLLYFIVEQVVQSEGRREAMYQKQNLTRQERDTEYLMLGLPVLKGLRDELSEVKKAASLEHHSFISVCSTLNAHVTEIRQIMRSYGNSERGGFIREMKGFLEECEEELKVVKEEQTRVMELVMKTNQYYLAGGSKDNMSNSNPFQLFVIVKDFVDMVDQACLELKKKLEKKNVGVAAVLTPPLSPSRKVPLRFPNFDFHFLSNMSGTTSSSQSEEDF